MSIKPREFVRSSLPSIRKRQSCVDDAVPGACAISFFFFRSLRFSFQAHDSPLFPVQDPNKPKRAMSAFFLYSQAFRSQVKEENPEATFGGIARKLAAQYKELPEKEMRKWEKKAEQDKIRYQEEMKHYVPMVSVECKVL